MNKILHTKDAAKKGVNLEQRCYGITTPLKYQDFQELHAVIDEIQKTSGELLTPKSKNYTRSPKYGNYLRRTLEDLLRKSGDKEPTRYNGMQIVQMNNKDLADTVATMKSKLTDKA